MEIGIAQLTAVAGVVSGTSAYIMKRYFDLKFERLKDLQSRKVQALFELMGQISEIGHSVYHVSEGDIEYENHVKRQCAKMREFARQNSAVIGMDLIEKVKLTTDCALAYRKQSTNITLVNWHRLESELIHQIRRKMGAL